MQFIYYSPLNNNNVNKINKKHYTMHNTTYKSKAFRSFPTLFILLTLFFLACILLLYLYNPLNKALIAFVLFSVVLIKQINHSYYLLFKGEKLIIQNRILPFLKHTFTKNEVHKGVLYPDLFYYNKTLTLRLHLTNGKRKSFYLGYTSIAMEPEINRSLTQWIS